MINPRYSEDEQAERLKEWWKSNGTSVITGAVLGIGIIVGVNLWRDHTRTQAENASAQFEQLLSSAGDEALTIGRELLAEYGNTPYAPLAALYMAKINYGKQDMESVETMLKWALENSAESSTQHTARLRLARVYLDTERVAEAEKLLEMVGYDGFDSEYNELIGDIAMIKGDADAARSAYEQAITLLPRGSRFSDMLTLKLDYAAGATTP